MCDANAIISIIIIITVNVSGLHTPKDRNLKNGIKINKHDYNNYTRDKL